MSFAVAAITTLAVGTAYSIYQGERSAKMQERAANEARQAAMKQADQADQANNRANKKRPNVAALLEGNQQAAMMGTQSTMLTGPGGVDNSSLSLGKNTLLGQ